MPFPNSYGPITASESATADFAAAGHPGAVSTAGRPALAVVSSSQVYPVSGL